MIGKSIQILSFVAALALMLPALYSNGLQVRKWFVRMRMEERLEQEHATTFRIASAELKWHEKHKEIIYQGQLVDIQQLEVVGDTTVIIGVYDVDETAIEAALSALTRTPDDDHLNTTIGHRLLSTIAITTRLSIWSPLIHAMPAIQYNQGNGHLPAPGFVSTDSPPPDSFTSF